MKRIIWRLMYDRAVVAALYELRETSINVHNAIKALQFEKDPSVGMQEIPERPGWHEFTESGYRIGIELEEKPEKTIRILYLETIE